MSARRTDNQNVAGTVVTVEGGFVRWDDDIFNIGSCLDTERFCDFIYSAYLPKIVDKREDIVSVLWKFLCYHFCSNSHLALRFS